MTQFKRIEKNGVHFATFVSGEQWSEGLSFFSAGADFVQVGTWNYNAGKELLAHKHNIVLREANRTQEVIFVVSGALQANVMDEEGLLIEQLVLNKNDTLILLAGAHSYKILENGTRVLEVKNGPYFGAEADRVRI